MVKRCLKTMFGIGLQWPTWAMDLELLVLGLLLMARCRMQLRNSHPMHGIVDRVYEIGGPYIGLLMTFPTEELALQISGLFFQNSEIHWVDLAERIFNIGKIKNADIIYVMSGEQTIRAKLVEELSGAEGVVIEEGTAGEGGKAAAQNGMRRPIFCVSPAGDTPSSARLFDAILSYCIPTIVSDELELPFEGILDCGKIALFVSSSDAIQAGWLFKFLKGVSPAQIQDMWKNLVQMAGKLINIKLHARRSQCVVKESISICTSDCRRSNITSASLFVSRVRIFFQKGCNISKGTGLVMLLSHLPAFGS